MALEDDSTWSVLLDTGPGGPAEAAAWTPAGGAPSTVPGIFSAAHLEAGGGDWSGVSTTAPVFSTAEARLPEGAAQGDALDIPGRGTFRAADLQPDGTGLVRVILEAT